MLRLVGPSQEAPRQLTELLAVLHHVGVIPPSSCSQLIQPAQALPVFTVQVQFPGPEQVKPRPNDLGQLSVPPQPDQALLPPCGQSLCPTRLEPLNINMLVMVIIHNNSHSQPQDQYDLPRINLSSKSPASCGKLTKHFLISDHTPPPKCRALSS